MREDIFSLLVAFGVTVMLLYGLQHMAVRIGLLDSPSERKVHSGNVPLIGGLSMFIGFCLGALTLDFALTPYRGFFAAGALLVIVGVMDDLRELSSRSRFIAQIIAAGIMIWWGHLLLADLGYIGRDGQLFSLEAWDIVFSIFCTVGVINALNMSDGVDGLAGGLSLIAILGLAWLAHHGGFETERSVLLLLAVVLMAFLMFNLRFPGRAKALVFMGDAGSMFLGFAITWFFIRLSQGEGRAMAPVSALWLLLLPLFDTVWLLFKRPLSGRWPTKASHEHLHHVLQMAGLSATQTVYSLLTVAALCAVSGLYALEQGVSEQLMFGLFLGLFAIYSAVMWQAWYRKRLLFWPIERRLTREDRRGDERRDEDRRKRIDRRNPGTERRSASLR